MTDGPCGPGAGALSPVLLSDVGRVRFLQGWSILWMGPDRAVGAREIAGLDHCSAAPERREAELLTLRG